MKLEYKVLWFEDQFSEVEGDVARLKSLIREYGFIPDFDHRDKISEQEIEALAVRLDEYNPYDLIIFDYDLGGNSANGLNIAAHLRNKIYTDMIFYSGKIPHELRKYLFDNEVDGVFIVHRDFFYDDIEPIIEDHIKKLSDLNNIRGVVMAVTSDIDQSIRDILVKKVSDQLNDEEQSKLLKKTKKKLIQSLKGRMSKVERIDSIENLIVSFKDYNIFDFNRIRLTYLSMNDEINDEINDIFIDESNLHKVIKERNKLAHEKAVINDGKLTLRLASGDEYYDHEQFKRVRNLLLLAHDDINKFNE
jgi:hypothetical protein